MPGGTPKPIVDKINKAVVKIASDEEFQKRHMLARGLAPVLDTPEQFAKKIKSGGGFGPRRGEGLRALSGLENELTLRERDIGAAGSKI